MIKEIYNRFKNTGEDNKIILKNASGAFLIKGGALAISFISTPAFINYFNDNTVLGLWYTLLSVLVWFLNFDLGIGNGVRNQLTKAIVNKDNLQVKRVLSSGIASIGAVTLVLIIIGIIGISTLNLNKIFNIADDLISHDTLFISAILVFLALMMRFALTFVSSILYALQKSAVNNFLSLIVSILQLIYVLVFRFDNVEDSLINLCFAYMLISNLPVIVAGFVIFNKELKDCRPSVKYVNKETTNAIMSIGTLFFACQILYMLIANTNEFLISNIFGSIYTAEYTFYYKVSSLVSVMVTLAMTPIWSMVTKVLEEKKYNWLWTLFQRINKVALALFVLQLLFIPFIPFVIRIWLGKEVIEVHHYISFAFAIFNCVFVYSGMLSTIGCGMTRIKLQFICFLIGVPLKFVFVYLASRYTSDWSIVVWSNVLVLLPYCIAQYFDLRTYLMKLKCSI